MYWLDWLDWMYFLKWYFILIQIVLIFITAIMFSSENFAKEIRGKKILLVTAHPDDEVMFFTPFLNYFRGENITLLCLSNGNSAGLGRVREKELEQAAKMFDIKGLEIIDKESLQDGMDKNWQTNEIIATVMKVIESFQPNAIVTFDIAGVSRHPNHVAIRRAMAFLKTKHSKVVKDMSFWELESTGLIRKYIGFADVLFSSRSQYAILSPSPTLAWKAMSTHHSQFVWYRKLFVVFSRYIYMNTFRKF